MYTFFNNFQRFFASHVILYHAAFSHIPKNLEEGLHNVAPEELYKELKWLGKNFDIVSVDELFEYKRAGMAAITFDDAYQSVFQEAIPVIKSLKVPVAIFINGCSFLGNVFWRDKIRFLINNSLESEFISYYSKISDSGKFLTKENFYWTSKSVNINSREIDQALDSFFKEHNISLNQIDYCLKDKSSLVPNELITYGNHSFNHYNLSSLSEEEQKQEIIKNHELLKRLGVKLSRVFSIPFGGKKHFNETTIKIIKDLGYKGYLLSSNRINMKFYPELYSLPYAERYMAAHTFSLFKKQIFKCGLKEIINSMTKK
jgi:peptidoglycan/xylan/chitin deacetylase (PgdA/CDA1 family)